MDAGDADLTAAKHIDIGGAQITLAPWPDDEAFPALLTISLADAAGLEWRAFTLGGVTLTRVRLSGGQWALLVVDSEDVAPGDLRAVSVPGGRMTVAETGRLGYRALLTSSGEDLTAGQTRAASWLGSSLAQNSEGTLITRISSSPAPFSPLDIPGLKLWLDASDAATLFQDSAGTTPAGIGDVVGRWSDKSGNNNHATQATTGVKPLRQDGYIAGDGSDDYLVLPNTLVVGFTAATGFIVWRANAVAVHGAAWQISGTGKNHYAYSGGKIYDGFCNSTRPEVVTSSVLANTLYCSAMRHTGTQYTYRLNGAVTYNAAGTFSASNGLQSLFANVAGGILGERFPGRLYEVVLLNRALSDSEIEQMEAYLAAKWGVTLA